jgi:hypothetical protein
VAIDICPACGYPTIGPDPCAVCRSIMALTGDKAFEPILSANEAASRIGVGGNAAPLVSIQPRVPARGARAKRRLSARGVPR